MFQGFIDGEVFEDFIKQLFTHYNRWPEPKSMLIIDNTSFYQTERIEQLCYKAGVKLVYLLLYSLDLNLIKEFFAELKAFIKKSWQLFKDYLE